MTNQQINQVGTIVNLKDYFDSQLEYLEQPDAFQFWGGVTASNGELNLCYQFNIQNRGDVWGICVYNYWEGGYNFPVYILEYAENYDKTVARLIDFIKNEGRLKAITDLQAY